MYSEYQTAIYHFCNYQPRCHKEVRNKLYEIGATTPEVEEIISELITDNLLNEEAYARAVARGRFRIKHWGKKKIVQHLKLNKISDYCIKKALSEIDPEEYEKTLIKLTTRKWNELKKERSPNARKFNVYRYMLQKGYEPDLVQDLIKELETNNE